MSHVMLYSSKMLSMEYLYNRPRTLTLTLTLILTLTNPNANPTNPNPKVGRVRGLLYSYTLSIFV